MNSSAQSQPGTDAGPKARARTSAQPSASVSFEVVNRYGTTLATAETEAQARQDVRYRASRGISGLSVVEVTTTVTRRTAYKPRSVAS